MDRAVTRARAPTGRRSRCTAGRRADRSSIVAWLVFGFEGGRVYRVNSDRITIGEVTAGTFDDFVPVRGQIAPLSTVYLETTEGGRVEKVFVEDGAHVKAGDPIFSSPTPRFSST